MLCPICFKGFKNYNSWRVHRWRFHNPSTKYRQTIIDETPTTKPYPCPNDTHTASVMPAMATAGVGVAAIAGNNWKRWLIIIVIVLAVAFLVWYFIIRKVEDEIVSSR